MAKQRGNVSHTNLLVLNAILYVAEHGCKWRGLPKRFGNWHTIYTRMNRWSKSGVLDRIFEQLQDVQIVRISVIGCRRRAPYPKPLKSALAVGSPPSNKLSMRVRIVESQKGERVPPEIVSRLDAY